MSPRDKRTPIAYAPTMSTGAEIIEDVKQLDERPEGECLEKIAEIEEARPSC